MVRLNELLSAVEVLKTINEKDIEISGLSYHSGKVKDGHLFVCIKGYKTDGHKYLAQAISNGAVAAVVEDIQEDLEIPQIVVRNSRIALARLADEFYGRPSEKMNMIGITATNGKTTTSFMTNAILEEEGFRTGLIGTVSIKIDDFSIPSELTTPESLDLQFYLGQMVDRDVSHVTMEVSSNALEAHRVEKVDYDIVTLNNVSREHIDSHGSFEKYFEIKSGLIRHASEKSHAILNLDCPYSSSLIDQTKAQVITFGLDNKEGHISCENLDLTTGRAKFTIKILKPFSRYNYEIAPGEFEIELSVPGLHSVYNAMVAIAIGLLSGVSITSIQKGLKNFGGVERRFEFIYEDDFKIIDDHFANAGNIDVTLQTLKYMDYKDLHLVYAIRGERGPTVNRENAEAIVKWAKTLGFNEVIATKSVSHVTSKDTVTEEETAVFQEVMSDAGIKVHLYEELDDAISHALSDAKQDDVVILAGAQGMDYGAGVALQQIAKMRPGLSLQTLFYPLRNRVAGLSKEQKQMIGRSDS
ncbi:Mur ligase family protein [Ferdinandcohnia sp. Marseille-Q9671]